MIKRLAILFLLAFVSTFCFAQANNVTTKVLNATQSVYLRGNRVDSISLDTLMNANSDNNIPSQKAVRTAIARSGYLNVQNFTGIPNGTADNSSGLSAAVMASVATGRTLYFPAGVYIWNNVDANGNGVTLPSSSGGFRIKGDQGVTVSTTSKLMKMFSLSNPYTRIEIQDINFVSTHDTTSVGNAFFLFQGIGKTNFISNVSIHGCTFTGFSSVIVGKGLHNFRFYDNSCLYPQGHDNGTTTTVPNISVRAIDDSLGDANMDWDIHDNYFDGFSGQYITTTKTGGPMDGFFYGHVSGCNIHDNTIKHPGTEGILYQPGLYTDLRACTIHDNNIDAAVPDSSKTPLGVPITGNVGIRGEGQNYAVTNNVIRNATTGILFYGTSWSGRNWGNPIISFNHVWITKDTTMSPTKGIQMQGSNADTISYGGSMVGNDVFADSSSFIVPFYYYTVNFYSNTFVNSNNVSHTGIDIRRGMPDTAYGLSCQNSNVTLGLNNFGSLPSAGYYVATRFSNSTTQTPFTNLSSGLGTLEVSGVLNVTSLTANPSSYIRVDSIVSLAGSVSVVVTAANTTTTFEIAPPINTQFAAITDASGTPTGSQQFGNGGATIHASVGDDNLLVTFATGAATGTYIIYYTAQYVVH